MSNKRHTLRIPAALICRFDHDGETHDCHIFNVSSDGLCVISPIRLNQWDTKELLFQPASMAIPARVKWCQQEKLGYAIGWAFEESAPEMLWIIRHLEDMWQKLSEIPEN